MTLLLTNLLVVAAGVTVIAERPMRCYQCNSADDLDCDSSDEKALKPYIKLCPLLQEGTYAGHEPVACRKIIQNVEDLPTQIIRECAYTGDKNLDGVRKQGSKAIKFLYYQCENEDGNTPCNGGRQLVIHYLTLATSFITIITALHIL